ncbi:MAG: MFS transporter [Bacteroidota bacterium]|nr:MFS transporter [Bacteroidota bacterium]
MLIHRLKIGIEERATFKLHVAYSVLEGIIFGVFALNEFIFLKSLQGTNYMLSFLFLFSMAVFLPTIAINELLRRTLNKKRMLRLAGILTRGPLVLLIFFPSHQAAYQENLFYHLAFLAIFLNYFMASPLIFPTINLFLKNNYSHKNFGRLFSWASSTNKIAAMLATFLFGLLLDFDNYAFRYVYPFIAVLGIASIFLLSKINYQSPEAAIPRQSIWESAKSSAVRLWQITRDNKAYRDFETGFMLYGFSFMLTVSVITIFLEKELQLSYSSLAFYKNGNVTLTIILFPFFGKLLGNIDPRKFAIFTFAALALYLFFVGVTHFFPAHTEILGIQVYYFLVLAFVFFALFAASMGLLWSIGSAYFCEPGEAGEYQAIHLSLTGTRAIIAPLLGIFAYEQLGYSFTFGIGILLLLIAVWLMRWSLKNRE